MPHEKGVKEGIEKGHQQMLQGQRQILLLLIQKQFPALIPLAEEASLAIGKPEEMQYLLQKVLLTYNELEVRHLFVNAIK